MTSLTGRTTGALLALAGVLILSPDVLLIRLVRMDHWGLLFWRGLLMGLCLGGGFLAAGGSRGALLRLGGAGWVLALLHCFGGLAFVTATTLTGAANVLVIFAAVPLLAALLSRVLLGEVIARRTWISVATGLGGIALVFKGSLGQGTATGDLCALVAACAMAWTFVLLRSARAVNMVPAIAVGSLLMAALGWGWADSIALSSQDAPWVLLMGLLVLPVSFVLITLAPRYIPAPEVSLIMLLETPLGPLWVWLALGEVPVPETVLAGCVILGTLALQFLASLWGISRGALPGPE